MGIFGIAIPGDSISRNPERTASRRKREDSSYIEALQQRANSLNIKTLLLNKEKQKTQVKEFSDFLCIGRCKNLGSLKSVLWCAPQLSGASMCCTSVLSHSVMSDSLRPQGLWPTGVYCGVFLILSFPVAYVGSGCKMILMDARWVFFPFLCPLRAQQLTLEGCSCWRLWHLCLLLWQEIFHFSQTYSILCITICKLWLNYYSLVNWS